MRCNSFEVRDSLLKGVVVCQPRTAIKGRNLGLSHSGLPFKKSVGD